MAATLKQPALLPVKVSTLTLLPTERVESPKPAARPPGVWIEVEFAGGQRLRIQGRVDRVMLRDPSTVGSMIALDAR